MFEGPVFIRSHVNPRVALTVASLPPAGAVTFATVETDEWDSLASQWVLTSVSDDVCLIRSFTFGDEYLQAASATSNAAVSIGAQDPTNELQLWTVRHTSDPHYIASVVPGFELGFPGDIPVPGLSLELVSQHDSHELGDCFTISQVPYPHGI